MTPATTLVPALLGLVTGLTLIIAIGAQNAFVLRLGIEGRNRLIAPVVAICALSDALLIFAGVLGLGALIAAAPVALIVIRVLGSAFLIGYALWAARRALRPGVLVVTGPAIATGLRVAVTTVLALTWLNPHVYLDTVLFLGAVATQQGPTERWWWAGGAMIASVVWFSALGFGARLLRPYFARPSAWRILDAVIAVVMLALGIRLALGY
ncbi:LysE/ArgO family amino acid transporter [Cryobacterium sp. CG_9.6]|uniref:LysE/ArgO family amino acid transporter n=1 Tax=Cryobacterium sp. CG_9.6 TaxID=2760710 RepID=UPI0024755BF1|nr:LysE/ArgO family amino acid transporter [Cryobacterium sp. CG_9.6]MDH6236584.1 L-lysine exporter family protein LysE/ArgO [Cryobacterium sp. CG_9.6]